MLQALYAIAISDYGSSIRQPQPESKQQSNDKQQVLGTNEVEDNQDKDDKDKHNEDQKHNSLICIILDSVDGYLLTSIGYLEGYT
jgi:hypothetical protein